MNEKELFLASIKAAEQKHEQTWHIEEQRKKNVAALETYLKKLETQLEEVTITEEVTPAVITEEPEAIPLGAQPLPQLPTQTMVTKSVELLSKIPRGEFEAEVEKTPDSLRKEIDLIKKTITDLHRFARNASQMGGGGEVNLRYLDDVARNTIDDNLFLRYNSSIKKFEFANVNLAVDWAHVPANVIPQQLGQNLGNTSYYWSNTYTNNVIFTDSTVQNTAYIPASFDSTYYNGSNVHIANTAQTYVIPLGTQYDGQRNITVNGNNQFVISHTGKFIVNFSVQLENTDNSQNDVYIWMRQNGNDVADSSSIFTVPARKNAGISGKLIAVTPLFFTANSGDTIQLIAAAPDSTANTVHISTIPARTNPTIPETPAVIITIQEIN